MRHPAAAQSLGHARAVPAASPAPLRPASLYLYFFVSFSFRAPCGSLGGGAASSRQHVQQRALCSVHHTACSVRAVHRASFPMHLAPRAARSTALPAPHTLHRAWACSLPPAPRTLQPSPHIAPGAQPRQSGRRLASLAFSFPQPSASHPTLPPPPPLPLPLGPACAPSLPMTPSALGQDTAPRHSPSCALQRARSLPSLRAAPAALDNTTGLCALHPRADLCGCCEHVVPVVPPNTEGLNTKGLS